MPDNAEINFDAPSTLRKWPSINHERVSASLGARPYMVIEGTLDESIRKFMAMPAGQHHLYEIHTAAQSDLVSAVLSAAHILELARLGPVARLVGIEGGVVSGVFNLESSGVEALDWRPRHDEQYHEA